MGAISAVVIWLVALAVSLPFIFGPWQPPEAITSLARLIDDQMNLTFLLTGVIFLTAQLVLGITVWRFGRKRDGAASASEGNERWEVLWTSAATVLFVGLALMGYSAWAEVRFDGARNEALDPDRLIVEVTAQQFVWNMRYPGADGEFGPLDPDLIDDSIGNPVGLDRSVPRGADDLIAARLVVPVGRQVELMLRSKDVLHNFFVPELRMKLDTVPGLTGRLHFTPEKVGRYEIACSELCGLGHYRMRAYMDVVEPAEYQAWLDEQAAYLE